MQGPNEKSPLKVFLVAPAPGQDQAVRRIYEQLKSMEGIELIDPNVVGIKVLGDKENPVSVFLLLLSASYKVPEYLGSEIFRRVSAGGASIIPVFLDNSLWNKLEDPLLVSLLDVAKSPVSWYIDPEKAFIELQHALESLSELRFRPEVNELLQKTLKNGLSELDLSGQKLKRIPRDLLQMSGLTKLELQANKIEEIENLNNLIKLETLDLSHNMIQNIQNMDGLLSLQYLDLEKNEIQEIKGLDKCIYIKTLGLSNNNIEKLSGLDKLIHLDTLYASRNKIKEITDLEDMTQLSRVVLSDNYITSIRPLLKLLKGDLEIEARYSLNENEKGIFVKGNPISDPPIEVVRFGKQSILDHFKKSETYGSKRLDVLKVVLIGNSGVGKTDFSKYLRDLPISEQHISTDTLDICKWETPILNSEPGKPIRVNIFDFGGQDYYHDLHRLFYSHDTAYVLIWDTITNSYSDNQTEKLEDDTEIIYENFPLEYWLESIKYNLHGKEAHIRKLSIDNTASEAPAPLPESNKKDAPPPAFSDVSVVDADLSTTAPVLVLQNKIDLGEGLLNQVALRDKYSNVTTFFNVSLATKMRVKILDEVLRDCLNKLNLAGRKLVSYQHDVVEKYLETPPDLEVLSLSEFRDKCASLVPAHKDLLDIADAKTIASILTNLGVVFFDQSEKDEDSIVFTSIGELSGLIREVMKAAKLGGEKEKGFFERKQLDGIEHIEHILPLLLKNSSVIQLDETQFLVPHFLPLSPESSIQYFTRAFVHCQIRYVYTGYFHKSLLMSLFAKYLSSQALSPETSAHPVRGISFWRNGLILSQDVGDRPATVFVSFVKEPGSCRIEIRSLYPFQIVGLERDVERELDKYNIGLNPRKEVSINSKDYFEVSDLIQRAAKNDFIFRSTISNETFTVSDFKHLVSFTKIPKKLFISYSSRNAEFVKRFWTHLSVLQTGGYIEPWYDRQIEPGSKWDDSIQKEMQSSDLVIFLLSPDFLATPYIMNVEVTKAVELESNKQCELYFIQLLHCSWGETVLSKYQMMLQSGDAAKKQQFIGTPDNDEAWQAVIDNLTQKVKS
jgi:GTPase SAR1 family protein